MKMIKLKMHPTNASLKDAGYSLKGEENIYDLQLNDMLDNMGWYLDNFETLVTYKVRWANYRYKKPTTPYRFTLKGDKNNDKQQTFKKEEHSNIRE